METNETPLDLPLGSLYTSTLTLVVKECADG